MTGVAACSTGIVRCLDDRVRFPQMDRRDVDLTRGQPDRVREVRGVADATQFGLRHDANGAIRARTVDADDFPTVVRHADEAH